MKKTLIAACLAGLLTAGCAQQGEYLKVTIAEIPEATLKCLPAPYRNKKFVKVNSKQVAYILARYKTAHADCQSKLNRVRTIYHTWKKQQAAVNG